MKRHLIVLGALIAIGAVLLGVSLQLAGQQAAAERAAYESDSRAPAPAHFTDDGLTLSTGTEGELVVATDLSCPTCQTFFATNGARVRELVAGGYTVRLEVLHVRDRSAANKVALGVFVDAVREDPDRALDTYLALSSAMRDVADDAAEDDVRAALEGALPADLRASARAEISAEHLRWLDARTYENRESVGYVPALTYDTKVYSADEADQAPDLSLE